jgi:hypothetical protein
MPWFYLVAGALGAVVGASELISRFRDAPDRALRTGSAWLYILLNASASLVAYSLVRAIPTLNTLIGGSEDGPSKQLMQALAAGISAMALFRSSLFTIRVGNTDIGIGPAAFLQILLVAADRATDRARAQPRAQAVQGIMGGISFSRAKEALPSLCFGLMQGLTTEEQVTFGVAVKALEASDMEDTFKANSLGLSLMNLVGEKVLREAVTMLRGDISAQPKPIVQSIPTLQLLQTVSFAESKDTLLDGSLFVANKMQDATVCHALRDALTRIEALTISDRQKLLLLSSELISRLGEGSVQYVLKCLQENSEATRQNAALPPRAESVPEGNVVAIHTGQSAGDPGAAASGSA